MQKVEVSLVIDTARFRGLPLLVVVSTALILILDGLDIQIISLVAPLLKQEFRLSPASLGPVLAAALIGMAIGGFVLGGLGDRWGRRPTLLLSVALFASATLLGATSGSIVALTGWRLLTGIGLGGAIPSAMALLAEFTGPRWRTQAIAVAVIGVPIGGMIGAVIAAYVLPHFGWRAMFVIGGLPCAALAAIYSLLPESPRYLVMRPERRDSLIKVLNRLGGTAKYTTADKFEPFDLAPTVSGTGVATLFSKPLRRETVALWLIFLTNMFTIFTFFSWSPVILSSLGLPLAVAVRGSVVFNVAGVCGGIVSAYGLARLGSRWPSITLAALGVVTFGMISQLLSPAVGTPATLNVAALMAEIAVVGFVMIGIQTIAYRLSTHLYPTRIRSSGVGWAAGFGRLGGILSSFIAGWLLTQVHGAGLFAILALVVLGTLLGVLLIRRHLAPVYQGRLPSSIVS
jgi:MFS transporter, AAHS family, 4-hydroxybenzoate transporter